jgi:hypothetical protein
MKTPQKYSGTALRSGMKTYRPIVATKGPGNDKKKVT